MKPTEKDMKAMFGQTPDSFTLAMERALAGETPARAKPRRLNKTWSIVLIAMLALALTTGAYAAAVRLGLIDILTVNSGLGGTLPRTAQEALGQAEAQSWEVGPVTVSFNDVLVDGYIAYTVCQARMTDGSRALLTGDYDSLSGSEIPDAYRSYVDMSLVAGDRYGDLAVLWDGPIYSVSALLEIDYGLAYGEAILDSFWGSDGSMLTGNMFETNPSLIGETLQGELSIRVQEVRLNAFDLYDGVCDMEKGEEWRLRVPVELPVLGTIETRAYAVEGDGDLGFATVTGLELERTGAETYAHIHMLVTDETRERHEIPWLDLQDGEGNMLPEGVLATFNLDDAHWPEIIETISLGIDEMPASLRLTRREKTVTFKLSD